MLTARRRKCRYFWLAKPMIDRTVNSVRRNLERLECRLAPAGFLAAGADAGSEPRVRIFNSDTGAEMANFLAYDPAFRGGVRVASGDVNGDGVPDIITGAGATGGPHVKVFEGREFQLIASWFAFDATFTGGVNVAVGDFDRDGFRDVVCAAGEGGGPHVRIFRVANGMAEEIAGPLGSFFAYDAAFRGGVTVAVGNVDNQPGDELITGAGPSGGPHVKVFDANRNVVQSFFAYDTAFTGGVYVASGDFNNDGSADIVTGAGAGGGPHVKVFSGLDHSQLASFFAYGPEFRGGVRVGCADLNEDSRADIITGAGPGGGPHQRVFDAASLSNTTNVFAFEPEFQGGIQVSGLALDSMGDPASFQITPEIPVLERLARFVPNAVPSLNNWTMPGMNDASLNGKNVYIIAHGWAPGFINMVDAYASNNLPNPPLKWWQTINTALPQSPGTPASPEMFYGSVGDGVQISPVGLAYAITQADPNAVVFAYSWIEESATPTLAGSIPEKAYLSEAHTALNGTRLANALQILLAANFASNGGKLRLIGHSHGSKVATVAANVLAQTGDANLAVAHLTILDSPEDDSVLVNESDSANHLWYLLGALNIDRTPGSIFVDNYISEFDERLGIIQGVNPFNTSEMKTGLQNIVDVNLNGGALFEPTSFGDLHAYAFNWYAGGSLAWAQNPMPNVADQWSPVVNPMIPGTLAGHYTQSWTGLTQNQFALTAQGQSPSFNTASDTPTFTNLMFNSMTETNGASFNNGVVTLTESGSNPATFIGGFEPVSGVSGISFNFKFDQVGQGDQLVISVGTGFAHCQQIHYVMTGTVAGATPRFATLSLGSLSHAVFSNKIQIQLMTVAGSGAKVEVMNMQQFVS